MRPLAFLALVWVSSILACASAPGRPPIGLTPPEYEDPSPPEGLDGGR